MSSTLPTNSDALAEHAAVIRALGKRVIGDIVEIGRRLTESHGIICGPRGKHAEVPWSDWLKREFGWTENTARNFMQVGAMIASSPKFADDLSIPVSGLYLLARPSTTDVARDRVARLAATGERVSFVQVKQIVAEEKPPTKVRVVNAPQPVSKESDNPPTVTQLAEMGKQSRAEVDTNKQEPAKARPISKAAQGRVDGFVGVVSGFLYGLESYKRQHIDLIVQELACNASLRDKVLEVAGLLRDLVRQSKLIQPDAPSTVPESPETTITPETTAPDKAPA